MGWAFVQSKQVEGTTTATFTSALTNRSLIVVAWQIAEQSMAPTFTDTAGNSYTAITSYTSADFGGLTVGLAYAYNTSTQSSNVVTMSSGGINYKRWAVLEYTGLAASAAIDLSGEFYNASASSPYTYTHDEYTQAPNELLVAVAFSFGNLNAGTGFTARELIPSTNKYVAVIDDNVETASIPSITYTLTFSGSAVYGAFATFKEPAAVGGGNFFKFM